MVGGEHEPGIHADLSAFYFFAFGGLGAFIPFVPLLLESRGLDAVQIGWVMFVMPAMTLLAPPLWGALADVYQARLGLLRLTGLGSAAGCLAFLPDGGFSAALVAMAIYAGFRAPSIPLADAAAHASLGSATDRFARIRIWGSVGFALFAFTIGELDGSKAPRVMLVAAAVAYLLSTASTLRLRPPPKADRLHIGGPVRQFILQRDIVALLVGSVAYYIAAGSYDVFFGLHVRDLGFGDDFIGLAWMVAVGAEIGLMLIAPRLLRGRRGAPLLVLAALASVVRWGLLSQVESSAAILAAQTLHALTFGLWYLALVRYLQMRAPESIRTTVQAISAAFHGLGMMAGYLLGGSLFEAHGGVVVFQMAAGSAVVAAMLYGFMLVGPARDASETSRTAPP